MRLFTDILAVIQAHPIVYCSHNAQVTFIRAITQSPHTMTDTPRGCLIYGQRGRTDASCSQPSSQRPQSFVPGLKPITKLPLSSGLGFTKRALAGRVLPGQKPSM